MTCSGHKMTAPNRQNTPINNTLHYDALAVIRNQKYQTIMDNLMTIYQALSTYLTSNRE